MRYDGRDLEILARTVFGEARGEPEIGKLAVAWTIRNRAEADLGGDGRPDWWGEGIANVCLKPWQFSCWNPADPNRRALEDAGLESEALRQCLLAAAAVLADLVEDPTGGATHYHADTLRYPKAWGAPRTPCARIGNHLFYRGIET